MPSMILKLHVPDTAGSACSNTITQATQAVDAAASIETDPQTKQVTVTTQTVKLAIKHAVTAADYAVT